MSERYEGIGTRIRRLREERGMTMQQLADAAGVTRGAVNKLEKSDPRSLRFDSIERYARALGVRPEVLQGIPPLEEYLAMIGVGEEDVPVIVALVERLRGEG